MIKPKKVALRLSLNSGFAREVLLGIIAYNRKHGHWEIPVNSGEPISFSDWEDLKGWDGDGIIAPAYTLADSKLLQQQKIPSVNIADQNDSISFPCVTFDNDAIGQMAAEHLMKLQLPHYAFIGPNRHRYSQHRCESFTQTLANNDLSCDARWIKAVNPKHSVLLDTNWVAESHYVEILQDLPRPIGIFVANDRVGFGVLQACQQMGLKVPDDVCVLSTDNDEILCNISYPSLSSIQTSGEKFGWQAAKMLDQLMQGKTLDSTLIRIPPEGVVTRNSSDLLSYDDRYVAEAMRFIRNNAGKFIDVSDVLSVIPISRRSLERRFSEQVSCSIYKEITRVHIERAKKLLLETDWSILRIAQESGFNSTNRFEIAFRSLVDMPASEFRNQSK